MKHIQSNWQSMVLGALITCALTAAALGILGQLGIKSYVTTTLAIFVSFLIGSLFTISQIKAPPP